MKNFFAILSLLAVVLVLGNAFPQRPSQSPNPTVNLITIGLMDKLCKQKYPNVASTTPKGVSSSVTSSRPKRQIRTTEKSNKSTIRTTTPPAGPTCPDFSNLSFEQLISRVKAGLKPVGRKD